MEDKLTQHILVMLGKGQISKEAAVKALSLNRDGVIKVADGQRPNPSSSFGMADTAKMLALNFAMLKGMDLLDTGVSKLVSGDTQGNRDAVFQKLMRQHPGLQGKDPERAKANFNYIAAASPHLLKHPLILGDNVANMTAMGATPLDTLQTIGDVNKGMPARKPSEFVGQAASELSKAYFHKDPVAPAPPPSRADAIAASVMKRYDDLRTDIAFDQHVNGPPPPPPTDPKHNHFGLTGMAYEAAVAKERMGKIQGRGGNRGNQNQGGNRGGRP